MSKGPHYRIGFGLEARVMPSSINPNASVDELQRATDEVIAEARAAESDTPYSDAVSSVVLSHTHPPANQHDPAECGICNAAANPHTPADAITVRPARKESTSV